MTAENAGITLADSTIAAVTLNSYKYASIQAVSTQLYRDSIGNLEDVLAETGGRQIGLNFGTALTTGDGDTVSRVATGTALTAREWYLIAASHDAVNGMLRIAQHPLNRDGRGERPLVALADKAVAPRAT